MLLNLIILKLNAKQIGLAYPASEPGLIRLMIAINALFKNGTGTMLFLNAGNTSTPTLQFAMFFLGQGVQEDQ
ncbi:MAG: hypothetical protein COW21_04555 [Candidatus Aenigmarchaeota archaeon CG15_BIG_FIL_POST_REV_8_21_14_020_37_27]|nr:MAG: hypothetical protein COW21_04555 [Candidatus Aenigmarchaeota archaeon CG15_BIG_FIL_POST_REV_8_21_14_020_37_27]